MTLIYSDLVKTNRDAFLAKVLQISALLQINPNWLMQVMKSESTLNEKAVNKQPASVPGYNGGGELVKPKGYEDSPDAFVRADYRATGLIQFMPKTAYNLGTWNRQLYQLSNVEQLDYVYAYYKPYAGKIKSYADLYFVTFFPVAVGKPDDWVFQTSNISASAVAKANPGIDANKDGKITVAEFKGYLIRTVPDALKQYVFGAFDVLQNAAAQAANTVKKKPLLTIAAVLTVVALAKLTRNKKLTTW